MRALRIGVAFLVLAVTCALGPSADAADEKPAIDEHVLWALRWLKNHQSPDGHWDAKAFDAQCKLNRCDGAGDAARETTSTGLALLAFLGAGQTQQNGPNKAVVDAGLKRLAAIQSVSGFFGEASEPDSLVGQAIAALAMTETYGMTGDAALKPAAQKGVAALFYAVPAIAPWRADFAKDGTVSPEALAWVVCALKSAEISKLDVDPDAMKRVVAWFEARTDAKSGAVTNPATKRADDVLTATGVIARAFVGRTPKSDPTMSAAAATLAKGLVPESAPPVARHFATLAVFIAAPDDAARTNWCAATKAALEKSQRVEPDRDERGSRDPKDASMKGGGRVVATALSCLTLQVVGHAR